ncbi:MAG: pyridoxal phosphate-dependent aminotransferase [Candidatus Omnitrophica bacterium]|nr:pyridoxal phosphate-dependent aminotransferase [Candidatus Omnitrophota bacterium]
MEWGKVINRCLPLVNKSPTLTLTSLAKKLKREGKDVVNFAGGEPDFDTPEFIKEAAKEALKEGFTKYTPSTGIPQLKKAIAKKINEENGFSCNEENIIVTAGAKFAIFISLFALLNPQEEVIIPSPYWVSYPEMVKLAGGKVKILPAQEEENFKINPSKLKALITSKTKILILNYPNNPTGITYTKEELEEIAQIIRDSPLFVLSDEVYEKILFDNLTHTSFASLEGVREKTITINSFSKSFSMTGWRIGFMVAPKKIVEEASKIVDHTTSCPNSLAQAAAVKALENNRDWYNFIKDTFQKKRDLIYEKLLECPKLKLIKPQGTFYLFCNIKSTHLNSLEFSSKLLTQYLVAVIPSTGFGEDGYIRVSFATNEENILKGTQRIKEFLAKI